MKENNWFDQLAESKYGSFLADFVFLGWAILNVIYPSTVLLLLGLIIIPSFLYFSHRSRKLQELNWKFDMDKIKKMVDGEPKPTYPELFVVPGEHNSGNPNFYLYETTESSHKLYGYEDIVRLSSNPEAARYVLIGVFQDDKRGEYFARFDCKKGDYFLSKVKEDNNEIVEETIEQVNEPEMQSPELDQSNETKQV